MALGDLASRERRDDEASIPDTKVWSEPGPVGYADDADDELL
jgi:hypothetical protein